MGDLATLVATLDSDTEVTDTPVVSTASVRLRPSLRLRLRPRLIPTTDMDTLARGAMEDTEDTVSVTAVDTPHLDTPPLDTLVLATAVDTDTLVLATAVDTPALDTPDLATLVATLDSDTEVTDTPVASTASVRLRLRPSLRLRLRLRL